MIGLVLGQRSRTSMSRCSAGKVVVYVPAHSDSIFLYISMQRVRKTLEPYGHLDADPTRQCQDCTRELGWCRILFDSFIKININISYWGEIWESQAWGGVFFQSSLPYLAGEFS